MKLVKLLILKNLIKHIKHVEFIPILTVEDAINNSSDEIKAFDSIKVVKIENDTLYIEKNV